MKRACLSGPRSKRRWNTALPPRPGHQSSSGHQGRCQPSIHAHKTRTPTPTPDEPLTSKRGRRNGAPGLPSLLELGPSLCTGRGHCGCHLGQWQHGQAKPSRFCEAAVAARLLTPHGVPSAGLPWVGRVPGMASNGDREPALREHLWSLIFLTQLIH